MQPSRFADRRTHAVLLTLVGSAWKGIVLAIFVVFVFATHIIDSLDGIVAGTSNPDFFAFLILAVFFFVYYLAVHRPIVDVVVTKLYVRQRFNVTVSWSEAKLLRTLFCLNHRTLSWRPMQDVRALPVDERLSALMAAAHE